MTGGRGMGGGMGGQGPADDFPPLPALSSMRRNHPGPSPGRSAPADEFAALKKRVDANGQLLSYDEKLELHGLINQAEQGDAPAWDYNRPPPNCFSSGEERQFTAWH